MSLRNRFITYKRMKEYVLGLEPSNSRLEGRSELRANGELKYIEPNEEKSITIEINFFDDYSDWIKDRT